MSLLESSDPPLFEDAKMPGPEGRCSLKAFRTPGGGKVVVTSWSYLSHIASQRLQLAHSVATPSYITLAAAQSSLQAQLQYVSQDMQLAKWANGARSLALPTPVVRSYC